MKRLQLAVIGFGRLGRACAEAVRGDEQLSLAGIVRRPDSLGEKLPSSLATVPVVSHARQLPRLDGALICVPSNEVLPVARDLLQHGTPIVECASIHGEALSAHQKELDRLAEHHKVPAIVGAGWDPGALSLFRALFALIIPKGHTEVSWHTASSLHHTAMARMVPGVRDALAAEMPVAGGRRQRYIYVELEPAADPKAVEAAILGDPLFLEEETLLIPVESVKALEETGHGMVLERRGRAATAEHQQILLEGRYSECNLCATVMAGAARALPSFRHGARSLLDLPLVSLWGELGRKGCSEWL